MRRIAVIIAALVLLPAAGCAPRSSTPADKAETEPAMPWPKTPCRASVEAFLAMGGLSLAQMQTFSVREERLNGGQPGEQVGYWDLSGRPETCVSGSGVAFTVLPDCSISSWKTYGGCRVAGLEPSR
ncbi:MAG: hypothetical protein U1E42_06215 [Rhodospirillales bacterium]